MEPRLSIIFILFLAHGFAYYVQQRPVQVQQQVRTNFYPIRTNCPNNACQQQNRYRWNYRPQPVPVQPINGCTRCKNILPNVPNIQIITGPGVRVITQPIFPVTNPIIQTTTTTASTLVPQTPEPLKRTTGAPLITPVTETSSTTPSPKNKTELPTPPPYTDDAASQSTASWLRPSRKPDSTINPCPYGKPLTNSFDTAVSCNYVVQPNGGCPEDYWCHTGASFATSACCPTNNWGDRCLLIRVSGEGDALVPRWYYDVTTKSCKRFLYKGMKGNSNNFVTHVQCSEACEKQTPVVETDNPCRHSLPARDSDGKKLKCGPSDPKQCPKDHYCHVGEVEAVCCQGSGISDRCLLAINVGQGRALLKRFYYNSVAKRCIEFVYKGSKGNENNFLTFNECKKNCMRWSNPCPVLYDYGERKECSPLNNLCDKGEWCTIGSTKETTACCPGAISTPCKQPLETGVGNEKLPRWYADPNDKSCSRECKQFTYKGTKGNQNNFLSKQACEETCKPECVNPCSSGEMLLEPSGEPRHCDPVSPCPSTYWCHIGQNPDTTVCCSSVSDPCGLPKTEGSGDGKNTRWYFSSSERRCMTFIYRGINGNQNNFLTAEDCKSACPSFSNPCGSGQPLMVSNKPKICSPNERCPGTHFCHIGSDDMPNYCCAKNGDPCTHSMSDGQGDASLKRFYFDKDTKRCREFTYKGARGNSNNFLTMDDCEMVCPVFPNPCAQGEPQLNEKKEPIICGGSETCATGYFCLIGGNPETTNCCPGTRRPCDLPKEVGTGTDHFERWFYDGSIQMCRQFFYKGIKGNANNFLSREMCQEQCHELNPCLNGEPLIDASGERMLCTGGQKLDSCPKSHYCHVGSTELTTICCPRSGAEACDQPLNSGVGGESIPRYFFDSGSNKCQQFIYGGSKGNENNFISRQTCEELCPEHRNYCPHGLPLVDSKKGKPVTCGINQGCPAGHICHMSAEYNVAICCEDPSDFCLQPRDPGPCHNMETRYGYHPLTDSCQPYQFGGCEGTLNNFKSLERCTEICCKEYKLLRDQYHNVPTSP